MIANCDSAGYFGFPLGPRAGQFEKQEQEIRPTSSAASTSDRTRLRKRERVDSVGSDHHAPLLVASSVAYFGENAPGTEQIS